MKKHRITRLVLMTEQMFPDVFAYTATSKQDLQLSSFYFKSASRAPSVTPTPPKSCNVSGMAYTPHAQYPPDRLVFESESACIGNTPVKPVQLPPSRRVVKLTIVPTVAALAVGGALGLNAALCLLIPLSVSPIIATMWGSFLYLWLLITFVQLVSHSVYMCTSSTIVFTMFHLFVVVATAVLIPRSLFAKWFCIEACLSVIITSHQCLLAVLVYTHVANIKLYVTAAFMLVLSPMTQLVQLDPFKEETFAAGCIYSAITISTLYLFALYNSRGSVTVDVTIGACPTSWQSQD